MEVYTERAPQHVWIQLSLLALATAFFVALVWATTTRHPSFFAFLLCWILLTLATYSYLSARYTITEEHVLAEMWPFTTAVAYEDLKHVGTTERPLHSYVGYGLKRCGRKLFFVTCNQEGVVLEKKKDRGFPEALVLTPADPEAFSQLVNEQRKAWNRERRTERLTLGR